VPEILVTVGVVSAEIMAWLALVKTFPILGGAPALPARGNA
jgi:Ni/Fe-hydrogenase subunit HybB-like protein